MLSNRAVAGRVVGADGRCYLPRPAGPARPPPHGAIPVARPLPPGQPTMGVPAHGSVGYVSGVRPPPYPGRAAVPGAVLPPPYTQAERKPALLQVGTAASLPAF